MDKDYIEIARAYSRTIQLEPFAPTKVFMSAKALLDSKNIADSKVIKAELYDLCKETVDNDIKELTIERNKKIAKELS